MEAKYTHITLNMRYDSRPKEREANYSVLQILHSASESRSCVGNILLSIIPVAVLLMILIQSRLSMILVNTNQQPQSQQNHTVHQVEADMKIKN